MKHFFFITVLIFLGLAGCKKVPNLAINELDPKFPNYRPSPPKNLVTFKNYDNNSVGIAWKSTINQPISGYILSASKTGESDSYKEAFIVDSNQVNSDNIYQIVTPLLYKSTQEYYKTEAFYVTGNDTVFSDPVYSSVFQYAYEFHFNFFADSTPNFQLNWDHNFLNNDDIEVQVSGDSIDFETIYSGSIEKKYFITDIDYILNNSFFRFRIKTENETTDFYPINPDRPGCFEYFDNVFFYLPKNRTSQLSYGSNNIKFTFDNNNCEATEIVLLEGGFHPEMPLTEIKRVSKNSSTIEVENLQGGINYYFWLVAETDNQTSSLTRAFRVRF